MSLAQASPVGAVPAKKPQETFYRPELDILRFFAFLLVFISHVLPKDTAYYHDRGIAMPLATVMAWVPSSGGYGVDLFFCLSSYLITELLLRELSARGSLDVRSFYVRRILRIWPLYFAITLVAVLLPIFDSQLYFTWKHALSFLFFSGNWIWALKVYVVTPATPLWSISVEEQFYITWPQVVRRASPRTILRIASGLIIFDCLIRFVVAQGWWDVDAWHNTFTRLDPIALGAIVAIALKGNSVNLTLSKRWALLIAGLIGYTLVAGGIPSDTWWGMQLVFPLTALACAVILISVIGMPFDPNSQIAVALIYLGKISYGLYVFHSFAVYGIDRMWVWLRPPVAPGVGFPMRILGSFALTVTLAAISYRFLESPFLQLKNKFTHVRSGKVS